MAILLVARHWRCEFEWYQHAPLAERAGVRGELVEDIRLGRSIATENDEEQALLRFATSLLQKHKISDADYAAATQCFGTVGVVELTGLLGYYSFLAATLLAHDISLPSGATLAFSSV
jgi:4-carboxymuconolactone decarboxylase